ncbi:porin family protein [Flavihumibacter petaseus]|uniref:Outer membrane protein beta-barrel domain-containing protein n=1 Tax=Flavihumibacter petaseus NBRC 106054 TaxID=1220578 RepID=A0A0E9MX58_9BACT|nr:porin family protein [Flavihumibacter petaseus]GAO42174.1 hypothetical protein FPE01S_01_11870 [Flavihumibacter petaseus NBRC 106054]
MKMKQVISTGILATCLATAVSAQDNLSFGPTAGFGHTWLSNAENSRYQPAGNLGVSLIFSPATHWGIGADAKWSIEGNKTSANGIDVTNRIDYLRIPLKGIYFFGEYGQRVRPKLAFGPTFGFLLGGKQERTYMDDGHEVTVKTPVKDFVKSFDFGLTGSAGVNIRLLEKTWLNLDLGYYHGLTDVMESTDVDQKNRNLSMNVGLTFGIGKATVENSPANR